jgi:hypothetical protein
MQLTKVTHNVITCFRIEYNVIKIMCFVITFKKNWKWTTEFNIVKLDTVHGHKYSSPSIF